MDSLIHKSIGLWACNVEEHTQLDSGSVQVGKFELLLSFGLGKRCFVNVVGGN